MAKSFLFEARIRSNTAFQCYWQEWHLSTFCFLVLLPGIPPFCSLPFSDTTVNSTFLLSAFQCYCQEFHLSTLRLSVLLPGIPSFYSPRVSAAAGNAIFLLSAFRCYCREFHLSTLYLSVLMPGILPFAFLLFSAIARNSTSYFLLFSTTPRNSTFLPPAFQCYCQEFHLSAFCFSVSFNFILFSNPLQL